MWSLGHQHQMQIKAHLSLNRVRLGHYKLNLQRVSQKTKNLENHVKHTTSD